MLTETTLKLGTKSLMLTRLKLKGWASLETLRKQIEEDVSKNDFTSTFNTIVKFIETSSTSKLKWDELPWYHLMEAFAQVAEINAPTIQFPILEGNKKEGQQPPWEYKGRAWFFWLNLFSSNYGWTEQVIGDLDIDTALGLYQELVIDEQLDREWWWGLSEIAYPYNASTKKSEYKALERPTWMLPMAPKTLPVVKIRQSLMPVGQAVAQPKKDGKRGL